MSLLLLNDEGGIYRGYEMNTWASTFVGVEQTMLTTKCPALNVKQALLYALCLLQRDTECPTNVEELVTYVSQCAGDEDMIGKTMEEWDCE